MTLKAPELLRVREVEGTRTGLGWLVAGHLLSVVWNDCSVAIEDTEDVHIEPMGSSVAVMLHAPELLELVRDLATVPIGARALELEMRADNALEEVAGWEKTLAGKLKRP